MGLAAHLPTCGLLDLPGRLMHAFDQTRVREKLLDAWKALDVVDLIEQGQGEGLPDPKCRAQQKEACVVVLADLVERDWAFDPRKLGNDPEEQAAKSHA
jgi:hypothetical protein